MGHLEALPFVLETRIQDSRRRDDADLILELTTPAGAKTLLVEVKLSHLTNEAARHYIDRAHYPRARILFAPAVGRRLGETFEHEGVNFVDLAGNCFVQLGDHYIARIQGRSAPARTKDKALRAASYRALFALLVEPKLIGSPIRDIARATGGISPQTAATLRNWLVERGIVVAGRGRHHWSRGRRREALDLWVAGYATTLFPKLLIGRYRARESAPEAVEQALRSALGDAEWRFGGGAAADRLNHYYRGDRTLVYLPAPHRDLARDAKLVPDAAGPVVIAESPGPLAFRSPHPETVHPLLAYTDLLSEGDERARDAAREIRESHLADLERDE